MSLLEFTGTGGIIEGNLGAADVNVNLDAVYNFNPSGSQDDVLYVAHHADFDHLTAFTLSAWVYWRGDGGKNVILCKNATSDTTADRAFELSVNSSTNDVYLNVGDDSSTASVQSASELTQNVWNHIAVTFSDSGNVAKLYINGVLDNIYKSIPTEVNSSKV